MQQENLLEYEHDKDNTFNNTDVDMDVDTNMEKL
jgi:hypothetical protein